MTFWIDSDVMKLFRSMGPGYGPRMNDVRRSFIFARLAGVLEGEDLLEEFRETWMGKPKPSVPDIMARLDRLRRVGEGEMGTENWKS